MTRRDAREGRRFHRTRHIPFIHALGFSMLQHGQVWTHSVVAVMCCIALAVAYIHFVMLHARKIAQVLRCSINAQRSSLSIHLAASTNTGRSR